jgi:comEA protein
LARSPNTIPTATSNNLPGVISVEFAKNFQASRACRRDCVVVFPVRGIHVRQKKHPPEQPIDLNSATATELQQVPGIGPATAKAIINFREKSGPFQRVEDILAIHGISKQALERMRPYLTVKPSEIRPKTSD